MNNTLKEQMEALALALGSACPHRIVTRDYIDASQRNLSDLQAGVFTLISKSKAGYADYPGRVAQLGTRKLILLAQVAVNEGDPSSAVEDAEGDVIDEIEFFVSNRASALGDLLLRSNIQSGQLEVPFGWVVFELEWQLT